MMQAELSVEEIVRDRSLKVNFEKSYLVQHYDNDSITACITWFQNLLQ